MDKRIMTNVVLTGTFDPLHDGHKYFFSRAKELGDRLYVGVVSDMVVLKNKGHFPIMPQQERAIQLAFEEAIDKVILLSDPGTIESILRIPPHIYCFGPGQYPEDIEWNRKLKEILTEKLNGNIRFYNIEPLDRETFNSTRIREEKMIIP